MRFPSTLDELFATRSHIRVLRALDELPRDLSVSARELARRAGVSHPTASAVLSSLADQGIVIARRSPRADAYELNDNHVAATHVRLLLSFERQLFDDLLNFLRERVTGAARGATAAFVFGSGARRALDVDSDIDLAVTCPAHAVDQVREALDLVAEQVRARYGNQLNVLIGSGSVEELRRRRRRGSHLWDQITRDGIDLHIRPSIRERRG